MPSDASGPTEPGALFCPQVCSVLESLEQEYKREEDWCGGADKLGPNSETDHVTPMISKHLEQKEAFLKVRAGSPGRRLTERRARTQAGPPGGGQPAGPAAGQLDALQAGRGLQSPLSKGGPLTPHSSLLVWPVAEATSHQQRVSRSGKILKSFAFWFSQRKSRNLCE